VEATQLTTASPDYLLLARRAKWLSWASLGYMALEGLVAIAAGIPEGTAPHRQLQASGDKDGQPDAIVAAQGVTDRRAAQPG
jgi:hypothetical protein